MGTQLALTGVSPSLGPVVGINGEWGTAGGMALRESLSRGSLHGVMDVLDGLTSRDMANVLHEAGFAVGESAIERGRDAVLADVQQDVIEAVNKRVDGFQLRAAAHGLERPPSFAAKHIDAGFRGNRDAVAAIQKVLAAKGVTVEPLGDAFVNERGSLLCFAGQALEKGVQGFGFDGVPGKYDVPCTMRDVVDLHQAAAAAVAVESVCEAIDVWRVGNKVGDISHWVPDSVQRALQGSLSENSARMLSRAVSEGTIAQYAAEAGLHAITQTLAEHGLDVNALTIEQQAETLGLALVEPDRQRGRYVGPVVGADHRASLVKYARGNAIEVPLAELAKGQTRLQLGDTARVEFNKGDMVVKVAERESRSVGR